MLKPLQISLCVLQLLSAVQHLLALLLSGTGGLRDGDGGRERVIWYAWFEHANYIHTHTLYIVTQLSVLPMDTYAKAHTHTHIIPQPHPIPFTK